MHIVHELFKERAIEGWSSKLHHGHFFSVHLDHLLTPVDVRIHDVAIQREAVGDFGSTHVFRDGAKTKEWIASLFDIGLQCSDDLFYGCFILIMSELAKIV